MMEYKSKDQCKVYGNSDECIWSKNQLAKVKNEKKHTRIIQQEILEKMLEST